MKEDNPSPEVEEMEVVTEQLSRQLCIEDIDTVDTDNPQLCAEYVKDIYKYIMTLEVGSMQLESEVLSRGNHFVVSINSRSASSIVCSPRNYYKTLSLDRSNKEQR